ncbi:MAG: ribosome maturation factor RimP [Desulfovibrio sp.]|nr:ribosome maturation factor RimP [Desulfovibrio sp.]
MKEENKQIIWDLAEQIVSSMGLVIWGLDIISGPTTKVRLFIDSAPEANSDEEGSEPKPLAGIDECERVSRRLGLALEAEDLFPNAWELEVSTPGLERKFYSADQMRPYVGDMIEAALYEPLKDFGSRKVFKGKLIDVGEDYFELEPCSIGEDGQILPENLPTARIPFGIVRNARRIHIFSVPKKPSKRQGKGGRGK